MINPETELVGFAAFWPRLISKWVTGTDTLPRIDPFQQEDKLTSLETFNHIVTVPTDPSQSHPYIRFYGGKTWIFLPYEPVAYPRGAGE
jgi:hypothetical protein